MNLYIDIAISLILIFLVFSVIVYVLQELIAVNLNNRGRMLWRALAQVLDGALFKGDRAVGKKGLQAGQQTPLTDLLFDHPQIQALQRDPQTEPSYIPASNFAIALLELVANHAPQPTGSLLIDFNLGMKELTGQINYQAKKINLGQNGATAAAGGAAATSGGAAAGEAQVFSIRSPIIAVLQSLSKVSSSIDELQKNTEKWYNDYMNRVSGWYQSRTVSTLRWLAIGVTLFFNLNCIQLVRDIANNSVLRQNLVGISMRVVDHPEIVTGLMDQRFKTDSARITQRYDSLTSLAKNDTARQALQQEKENKLTDAIATNTKLRLQGIRALTDTLSAANLAIGWGDAYRHRELFRDVDQHSLDGEKLGIALLGWLITAGCLSMGAPFWFNLLMQLVNVRRAGVKPKDDGAK